MIFELFYGYLVLTYETSYNNDRRTASSNWCWNDLSGHVSRRWW